MACTTEYARNIAELSAGELDARAVDDLLDHVETCAACSDEVDDAAIAVAVLAHEPRASPAARHTWLVRLVAAVLVATAGTVWFVVSGSEGAHVADLAELTPLAAPRSVLRGVEDAPGSAWDEAALAYAREDWAAAAKGFEAAAEDPARGVVGSGGSAWLYAGIAHAQGAEYDGALRALETAEEVATGLLLEQVLWFRAAVELARDDGLAARGTLSRLIALDGDYVLNARDVLDALQGRLPR